VLPARGGVDTLTAASIQSGSVARATPAGAMLARRTRLTASATVTRVAVSIDADPTAHASAAWAATLAAGAALRGLARRIARAAMRAVRTGVDAVRAAHVELTAARGARSTGAGLTERTSIATSTAVLAVTGKVEAAGFTFRKIHAAAAGTADARRSGAARRPTRAAMLRVARKIDAAAFALRELDRAHELTRALNTRSSVRARRATSAAVTRVRRDVRALVARARSAHLERAFGRARAVEAKISRITGLPTPAAMRRIAHDRPARAVAEQLRLSAQGRAIPARADLAVHAFVVTSTAVAERCLRVDAAVRAHCLPDAAARAARVPSTGGSRLGAGAVEIALVQVAQARGGAEQPRKEHQHPGTMPLPHRSKLDAMPATRRQLRALRRRAPSQATDANKR
jgi:hypothetical protein